MQTAKSSEEKMARVAETNSGKERTARKKGRGKDREERTPFLINTKELEWLVHKLQKKKIYSL